MFLTSILHLENDTLITEYLIFTKDFNVGMQSYIKDIQVQHS